MADNRITRDNPDRLSNDRAPIRRMHAVVAFASLPLFLGALLGDLAYASSFQVQWTNFADWLNAGGLALAVLALVWAVLAELLSRPRHPPGRRWLHATLLAATVVLGLANAFVHAKDGWAAMPAATVLSLCVLVAAAAASVVGLTHFGRKVAV